MATITFDTLKFTKKLREAGFSESQAEAVAEAQKDILSEALDNTMASKSDMLRLESEIKTLEVRIAETKADLIRWVVGAGFLQTTLIALLLMKLIK